MTQTTVTQWAGSDEAYWEAVEIYNDPDAEEDEAIAAAVLLQKVLILAQDALTRPATENVAEAGVVAAVLPPRVVARPKPGDMVEPVRAVELFAEGWVLRPAACGLRPAGPVGDSTLSPLRDYRVQDGQLQYNAGFPVDWQDSGGIISDCPQWLVIAQQMDERASRTTAKPAVKVS